MAILRSNAFRLTFGVGAAVVLILAFGRGPEGALLPWSRWLLLPLGFVAVLILALGVDWLARSLGDHQPDRPYDDSPAPLDPAALAEAAETQSRRAREFIDNIRDSERREALKTELQRLDDSRRADATVELNVVVFGTVSAGKTSLINALVGRKVGETGAVMGTTRERENHTYTVEGVGCVVHLTDTPGMSEAGEGGMDRETAARDLAKRADLLLFVVDHDLIRSEYRPLVELIRLGKRSIVILNKKDRFPDEDLKAILSKLRERLESVIPVEDVVPVAAAPRPIPVRTTTPDGKTETVLEVQDPDLGTLRDRIARILADEGPLLRAANLLLRTKLLTDQAESGLAEERRRRAEETIDHYQWVTASTVFTNPVPALNLAAGAAVQLDLIADLARVYGVEASQPHLRALAARMGQAMVKVGLVEAATSLVAGLFKRTPLSFAAAGALQAATTAYLSRVAGKAASEYFRHGQDWGPGDVEGALLRAFEANSRADFLQDFARQGVDRLLSKLGRTVIPKK